MGPNFSPTGARAGLYGIYHREKTPLRRLIHGMQLGLDYLHGHVFRIVGNAEVE
jgi:hypothetical protein